MLEQAAAYVAAESGKTIETYYPAYHLAPETGWMNDPNGFVYFRGQYHMFYQFHPYAALPGLMYWGHAVSRDLVRWEHLPPALAPDKPYDCGGCWSGGAVVKDDRLYLLYTGTRGEGKDRVQTQNLAYSDDGVNFTKYGKNPVITSEGLPGVSAMDFRDPFVWERGGAYYALVGSVLPDAQVVLLFESQNLTSWQYKNFFLRRKNAGFCWECPNYAETESQGFLLVSPVDYKPQGDEFANFNSTVYAVGRTNYAVGVFSAGEFKEVDRGFDFYATQLTSAPDGRIVLSAWMNMWERRMATAELKHGWAGQLILPRELRLAGGVLLQTPVREIERYYGRESRVSLRLQDESAAYPELSGRVCVLEVTADMTACRAFEVHFFERNSVYTALRYADGTVEADRTHGGFDFDGGERESSRCGIRRAGYLPKDGILRLRLFLDQCGAEAFFGEGELVMSLLSVNGEQADGVSFSVAGKAAIEAVKREIEVK